MLFFQHKQQGFPSRKRSFADELTVQGGSCERVS